MAKNKLQGTVTVTYKKQSCSAIQVCQIGKVGCGTFLIMGSDKWNGLK